MTKRPNAKNFLASMANKPAEEPAEVKPALTVVPKEAAATESQTEPAKAEKVKRIRRRHFGAYLEDDTLEHAALLRIRLGLDNSGLVKLAIEELAAKHKAKRAFGDT